MEVNLNGLALPEQHHTLVASGAIFKRVTIRPGPSSLMANYSKIKRVEPPCSYIAMAVKED